MAINTYPAVASPIKSIQRGSAAGAGTVTISAIDISKSTVNVFGSASSGTVSASFNMSMNAGSATLVGRATRLYGNNSLGRPAGTSNLNTSYSGNVYAPANASWTTAMTVNSGNASVGAGSNNLVAAVVQGYLANSTSLVVSGACRWEVVEYN